MKILYHVIPRINPSDLQAPKKFYGVVRIKEVIRLNEICGKIAAKCALTKGDVMSAVQNLVEMLNEEILSGNKVELGNLGTFSPSISTEGVENEFFFNSRDIKKLKINFTPSKELKNLMKAVEFEKYHDED